jgi:hypothetical protein
VTETQQVTTPVVVAHRNRRDKKHSTLAVIVLLTSTVVFLGLIGLILMEEIAMDDAITACPDPAGALYISGRPRWSNWPPGSYCDYRAIHPEWPASVAVQQRPPTARAVLLLVTPLAIGLSVVDLTRRARRRPT